MAQIEVADQKQKLATANSRITHLEDRLTENPSKAQALETELAKAITRASNAEDNSRYLEGQLRDANNRLTSIQNLAAMYAVLAREVADLPIRSQALALFGVETVAVEVAPLLFRVGSKGNLRSFLAAGPSGWHCLETIVDGITEPKGNECRDHKGDCVEVRVVNGRDGPLLDFSISEE
ncbi:hypothetical protein FCIRC_6396 [Fusarium circinatum]|uniref:Uncharacterized protein n=1 Tax=Fusarium circinatum TaxID=48490 RepID=A0A8H5X0F0_FUSCI|nr:hypothetical protein FCIRC_6396 [Fusarium circinatum]